MGALVVERGFPVAVVVAGMLWLYWSDPYSRQRRKQRHLERRASREWAAYCQGRWQRVSTLTLAGQHTVAANEAARLRDRGIPDPRKAAVHR